MRHTIYVVLVVALLASLSQAGVVDTSAAIYLGSDTGTESMTVAGDADRIMVAFLCSRGNSGASVNSLTYADAAFTPIAGSEIASDLPGEWASKAQAFYLLNPAAGTNDLAYDVDTDNRGSGLVIVSISGAAQQAPTVFGTYADSADVLETTMTGTPTAAGMLVAGLSVEQDENADGSAGTNGLTKLASFSQIDGGGAGWLNIAGAIGVKDVSTSETTIGWTWTKDGYHAHSVVEVADVPEPATMGLLALGGLVALKRRRTC